LLNFALREIPLRKSFEGAHGAARPAEPTAEQPAPIPVLAGVGEGDD